MSQFSSTSYPLSFPVGVAVDPATGAVYVSDDLNNRVQKFSSTGTYWAQFGSAGSGSGQLAGPWGLAVDPSSGDLYVVDGSNNRVEKFGNP